MLNKTLKVTKMGKSYSKTEEKDIIIAQNASRGNNGASDTEQEYHIKFNNVLITTFLVLMAIVILAVIYQKLVKKHKRWINQQVDSAFIRRMRQVIKNRKVNINCIPPSIDRFVRDSS